ATRGNILDRNGEPLATTGKLKQLGVVPSKLGVLIECEVQNGKDIKLTIDAKAQKTAFDSLGGKAGSTVATTPKTGDLLALASSPSYDPNKMTNGISQEDYKAYEENPEQPFIARFATG
uniref:Penicillin-binding protein 3, low affinity (Fragments) n=1 Tax=Enterococcus hirae TaxID=1354 RepID=Q7M0T8_ENTHR